MTLIVETGAGLAGAESYASVADTAAYAAKMGLDWTGDTPKCEPALRRATRWLDSTYRGRFVGIRRLGRGQALEWPRVGAYVRIPAYGDASYGAIGLVNTPLPYDAIPPEIISATMEAAIREAAEPGTLLPDTGGQGAPKVLKVGDVSTEFFQTSRSAAGSSGYANIDAILSGLLGALSGYTARAARG